MYIELHFCFIFCTVVFYSPLHKGTVELTKKAIRRDLETNILMAISNNKNDSNINNNFSVNNLRSYDCFLSSSKGKALRGSDPDICNGSFVLNQLSHQPNWELVIRWDHVEACRLWIYYHVKNKWNSCYCTSTAD